MKNVKLGAAVLLGVMLILGAVSYLITHKNVLENVQKNETSKSIPTVSKETYTKVVTLCEKYSGFSKVQTHLKNNSVKVPVILPPQLPSRYTAPSGDGTALYVESSVADDGGYSVSMSWDFGGKNYNCEWAEANYEGSFSASVSRPKYFGNDLVGEKISLADGITGYYHESGRGDSNIDWIYKGTFYQVSDLDISESEAVILVNDAIANVQ